jgi:hypothetical protein
MSEVTNQEAPQQDSAPGLNLQDLVLVVQTLQVIAQRGAIKADELTTVGGLYDRLVAFLEHSGVIKKPGTDTPADNNQTADSQGE